MTGMEGLESFARLLIVVGLVVAALGGVLLVIGKVPFLGKLPGDIYIQRRNFTFYFPVTTSIVLSILLTLLLSFLSRR
jgi:hypothetical protein